MNRGMIVPAISLALCLIAVPDIASPAISALRVVQSDQTGPRRGMSMEQVESQYGEPNRRYEPVGDPPITRWEYPNFVVYFEYQYVIHSVAKKSG